MSKDTLKEEIREDFVTSLQEMHDEGYDWLFAIDIEQKILASGKEISLDPQTRLKNLLRSIRSRKRLAPMDYFHEQFFETKVQLLDEGVIRSIWSDDVNGVIAQDAIPSTPYRLASHQPQLDIEGTPILPNFRFVL